MFETIIEQLKNPVTSMVEKSKEEGIKKGTIKLVIISAVMALINVITSMMSILSKYSSKSWYADIYEKSELSKMKWDAIKDAELFGTFFKTWVIIAIGIAVVALVLWIIAKFIKSPKEYSDTLSIVNSAVITFAIASIINIILSKIYAPLGIIFMFAVSIYIGYSVIFAYERLLEVEDTDKLVLISTGVFTVLLVVLIVVFCAATGTSLKSINALMDLL